MPQRPDRMSWLIAALVTTAGVAVLLAVFVTHGWADAVLMLLALAALVTGYGLRREARRRLLYSRDDDDVQA